MTKEETLVIIKVMMDAYSNYHPEDMERTAKTWAIVLRDFRASDIQRALTLWMQNDRSGFAPSPGQLIGMLDNTSSAEEEWLKVRKAICNSGYHSEEEFAKLSLASQRAVGSAEMLYQWSQTDLDIIDTSVAKQFKDGYKAVAERMKRDGLGQINSMPHLSEAVREKESAINVLLAGLLEGKG